MTPTDQVKAALKAEVAPLAAKRGGKLGELVGVLLANPSWSRNWVQTWLKDQTTRARQCGYVVANSPEDKCLSTLLWCAQAVALDNNAAGALKHVCQAHAHLAAWEEEQRGPSNRDPVEKMQTSYLREQAALGACAARLGVSL